LAKDVLKQEVVAVNLGIEEVKYGSGKDCELSKGVVSCCGIRRTSVIVIKGILNLIYLLEEGYYYVVLLLYAVRAALTLLHI